MKDYKADEGLQGNDKIEKAIAGLPGTSKRNYTGDAGAYTYRYPQTHERCWSAYHCCRTAQW